MDPRHRLRALGFSPRSLLLHLDLAKEGKSRTRAEARGSGVVGVLFELGRVRELVGGFDDAVARLLVQGGVLADPQDHGPWVGLDVELG